MLRPSLLVIAIFMSVIDSGLLFIIVQFSTSKNGPIELLLAIRCDFRFYMLMSCIILTIMMQDAVK